jgi:hypothetical protein
VVKNVSTLEKSKELITSKLAHLNIAMSSE